MYKVNISELKALKDALTQSNDLLSKISKNTIYHSKIRQKLKSIIKENEIQIKDLYDKFYI